MNRLWAVLFLMVPIMGVGFFAFGPALGIWLPEDVSQDGYKIDHLFYFILVLTGIVFIVLVFLHVPRVNGPEYWIWRWQRRTDVAKIAIFFILAASPALIAQILFRRHRALALGLLALATAALQLAGNAIQPELHGVDRMRRIANDQLITSYSPYLSSALRMFVASACAPCNGLVGSLSLMPMMSAVWAPGRAVAYTGRS